MKYLFPIPKGPLSTLCYYHASERDCRYAYAAGRLAG